MGAAAWGLDAPVEPTALDPLPAPRVAPSPATVQWLHVCGYHTEGPSVGIQWQLAVGLCPALCWALAGTVAQGYSSWLHGSAQSHSDLP